MSDGTSAEITPDTAVTRRNFLVVGGLAIAAAGCGLLLKGRSPVHFRVEGGGLPPPFKPTVGPYGEDLDFSQYPLYKYDQETQSLIEHTEDILGIKILTPRFWR